MDSVQQMNTLLISKKYDLNLKFIVCSLLSLLSILINDTL